MFETSWYLYFAIYILLNILFYGLQDIDVYSWLHVITYPWLLDMSSEFKFFDIRLYYRKYFKISLYVDFSVWALLDISLFWTYYLEYFMISLYVDFSTWALLDINLFWTYLYNIVWTFQYMSWWFSSFMQFLFFWPFCFLNNCLNFFLDIYFMTINILQLN